MTEKSEGGQFKVCEFCKCNTNARIRRCCKIGTVVDEGRIQAEKNRHPMTCLPCGQFKVGIQYVVDERRIQAEKYKQQLMFHDSHTPAPAMITPECMQGAAYLEVDEEVLKSILPLHMNKAELPDEQGTTGDVTVELAKLIDDVYSVPFTYMPSHVTEQPTTSSKFLDDLMYSLAIDEANAELRAMLYESNE